MNAVAKVEPERRSVSYAAVDMDRNGAGGALAPKTLGDVVAFAQVMARADLALPKHLRGNDGACLAVSMQAMRWEMDPFAVANKSYAVNDRLAYEAQLIAAVVHTRAPIKGRPQYVYSGEGGTRRCQIVCVMADGEEREYTSPTFGQITTKNSPLWKSDPDQQLGYFAIRSWARRHAPEVILGVYTPDEVETFRDTTPAGQGTGMRARLEARQVDAEPNGGFDAEHVAAELAETVEFEGGPMPADDPPSGVEAGPGALDLSLDEAPPSDEGAEAWDAVAYAQGQRDNADAITSEQTLVAWWGQLQADEAFKRLVSTNAGEALAVKAHVQKRLRALKAV
jgi:hypothetical protein